MVDYVIPSGVRIADADRVRLGAHLAPGTTVMHEGFVNFNAGTLGTSMVEGRISSGVVVDDGSDIGGGASIMGTLSGGGKEVISVGKSVYSERTLGLEFLSVIIVSLKPVPTSPLLQRCDCQMARLQRQQLSTGQAIYSSSKLSRWLPRSCYA